MILMDATLFDISHNDRCANLSPAGFRISITDIPKIKHNCNNWSSQSREHYINMSVNCIDKKRLFSIRST